MASTRPPKTYSPSFRTGRRSEGSGGVVGMVRCAGCDAWPGSLRSSMRTSREACSGWGAVEPSFLGAILHVSTHAPSACTAAGGSGPEVPAAGAGPTPAPPESSGSYRAAGGGLQGCPTGATVSDHAVRPSRLRSSTASRTARRARRASPCSRCRCRSRPAISGRLPRRKDNVGVRLHADPSPAAADGMRQTPGPDTWCPDAGRLPCQPARGLDS